MQRIIALLMSLTIIISLFSGCSSEPVQVQDAEETAPVSTVAPVPEEPAVEEAEPLPVIRPLNISRSAASISAAGSVKPHGDYFAAMHGGISEDLSGAPALAYSLNISNTTRFAQLPAGYDQQALIEWGKYPGLNVDILHEHGFTGKGATIAYVDQPIVNHEQYKDLNLHYVNNANSGNSMHGPMVLSLLAGKDCGTAPEAEIYFYGHSSWLMDQTTHAECLYQIIEQNESLPEGEKISMVGFSDNIDYTEKNADAFKEAVEACEAAGIMVFFCGDYQAGKFIPMSDKNCPENMLSGVYGNGVVVPAGGVTGAAETGSGNDYYYWGQGGLSWTMPYVLGLYGIAHEIDPSLTKSELLSLLSETATKANGMSIINPVGFVSAALQRVERNEEAQALQQAVAARQRYLYAVMDTANLSSDDLGAITNYLANIDGVQVLVVDTATVADAKELYTLMKEDAASRGGTVAGVQIFGTPSYVPSFSVKYKVQMISGVDDGGVFLSDLFYGNFENDPGKISNGYNVMDHFAEGWDVDLVPQWAVARLPLQKGEFADFFKKYNAFVLQTGLEQQPIVNFSNPIFPQTTHSDSFGRFLQRLSRDKLVDVAYTLYGNQDGSYPVDTRVEGNFIPENLAAENSKGIMELIINSHGQWNNIDQCIFVDGKEQRISFLNMDTINDVLSDNPYYLDCWTCLNGYQMSNNLTTAALSGQCVGAFTATDIISNNGANCDRSYSDMANSNFYYFYYHYLKSLDEGSSRSQAFLKAQQEYSTALINDSLNGIRGEGNYQFNFCNLLAYHNFGVLEPSFQTMIYANSSSADFVSHSGESVSKPLPPAAAGPSKSDIKITDADEVSEKINLRFDTENRGDVDWKVSSYTAQKLDNGNYRLTLTHTAGKPMGFTVFDPPNGSQFMYSGLSDDSTIVFEISEEEIPPTLTVNIDSDKFYVFFMTYQLK